MGQQFPGSITPTLPQSVSDLSDLIIWWCLPVGTQDSFTIPLRLASGAALTRSRDWVGTAGSISKYDASRTNQD